MIALVVYACLASQPESCSQNVVLWAEQPKVLYCADDTSAPLDAWAAAHPDLMIKSHWCMPGRATIQTASAKTDPRILPLEACDVRNRATAIIWSSRNPGVSAAAECKRLMSN